MDDILVLMLDTAESLTLYDVHVLTAEVRHQHAIAAFHEHRRDAAPRSVVGEEAVDEDRGPRAIAQLDDV